MLTQLLELGRGVTELTMCSHGCADLSSEEGLKSFNAGAAATRDGSSAADRLIGGAMGTGPHANSPATSEAGSEASSVGTYGTISPASPSYR